MEKQLRIAWFAPDPAVSGGAAAYAADVMLPLCRNRGWQIDWFTADRFERGRRSFLKAVPEHLKHPYDHFLYQLDDTAASEFALLHHAVLPGAVWLHDYYLQPAPHRERFAALRRAFAERHPGGEKKTYAAEAESGLCAFFSEVRDFSEARRQPGAHTAAFYHVPLPVRDCGVREIGCGRSLVVGLACGTGLECRAAHLLRALCETVMPVKLLWLCPDGEERDAAQLCAEFGIGEVELHTGRSPKRWEALVPRCDAAFHCRFSAYGSANPYLAISMMAGVPVITSDYAASAELPESAVWRIRPGENEISTISETLRQAMDPEIRAHKASAARHYAAELHAPAAVFADLEELFCRVCPEAARSSAAEAAQLRARWASMQEVWCSSAERTPLSSAVNQAFGM